MYITLTETQSFAHDALLHAAASPDQASAVALSIRAAEAHGTRGIGLGYLPWYRQRLRVGKIAGTAVPQVSHLKPGAVFVDARGGFAHQACAAGEAALSIAAQTNCIVILDVANAYACGVLCYFADRLARAGLVSVCMTNALSTIALWGGKSQFFGTNPWAFGAPRAGGDRLMVNSSSSATANVNLANAAKAFTAIPNHVGAGRGSPPHHRCGARLSRVDSTCGMVQGIGICPDIRGVGRRSDKGAFVVSGVILQRRSAWLANAGADLYCDHPTRGRSVSATGRTRGAVDLKRQALRFPAYTATTVPNPRSRARAKPIAAKPGSCNPTPKPSKSVI